MPSFDDKSRAGGGERQIRQAAVRTTKTLAGSTRIVIWQLGGDVPGIHTDSSDVCLRSATQFRSVFLDFHSTHFNF